MNNFQIIDQYNDRFLDYSGISLDDQFHFFHVTKNLNEEQEVCSGYQEGILRFDALNKQYSFTSYPNNIYFESHNSGKTVIHIASLDWEGNNATLTIYKFDCTTMKQEKVYHHHFIDDISEDFETSALWRIELYSLDDDYVVVKVPDLNPFSQEKNYGFSECLLIDLKNRESYTIPPYLNVNDSFLNLSHIKRYTWQQNDFLIISTGRVSLKNKKDSWKERENGLYNTIKHQSKIIITLDQFIKNIKEERVLEDRYIVDTSDFFQAYVSTVYFKNRIYFLKTNFSTNSSELVEYELKSQDVQSLNFTLEFEKIMINENNILGVTSTSTNSFKQIHALDSGLLLYKLEVDHTLEFFDNDLIITKYTDELGTQNLYSYDADTNDRVETIKGERVSLFILESQDGNKHFLVHVKQI